MKELLRSVKSVYGLFLPYRHDGRWVFTFSVGHVPLGWIMIAVALIF